MSKNRAMFSDVKHFTLAAEMPSVVIDSTGCLFKKDQIHFFPSTDFSLLNGCFKPFIIAN
jgi:hypothetical protein